MTPLLKRLEAAGRVKRERDAVDERQVRITLTAAGLTLKKAAKMIPSAIDSATNLRTSDIATLRRDLTTLRRGLEG